MAVIIITGVQTDCDLAEMQPSAEDTLNATNNIFLCLKASTFQKERTRYKLDQE